ncbi:hypothetical protein [Marispirochaeta aestuarii]|uniref:hypothetical protein n=1 Tax=Marispirochaeta aestuarii TaxID=1963862 RepID=UPI0029C63C6B|nr:hypothetical protein [Marispirochaeta aestuarii]
MNTRVDRMRYQQNQKSYNIGLLSFLFYCIYIANTLDYIPKTMSLGIEILISLAIFMGLFLGIEGARNYSVKASRNIILLGALIILKVFWHPLVLWNMEMPNQALWSGGTVIISGVFLVLSGIVGLRRGLALEEYNRTHPFPAETGTSREKE